LLKKAASNATQPPGGNRLALKNITNTTHIVITRID
jgi:hypothetical protein